VAAASAIRRVRSAYRRMAVYGCCAETRKGTDNCGE